MTINTESGTFAGTTTRARTRIYSSFNINWQIARNYSNKGK